MLLMLFFSVTYCEAIISWSSASQCRLNSTKFEFEYKYNQEGDIIIGGLISLHTISLNVKHSLSLYCDDPNLEEYKSVLAIICAVEEINKDPNLLPNVTLGYHILDTCADPKKTLGYALQILSGENMEVPNYSCWGHKEVAGFIGDSGLHTSKALAQLLTLYQYTQIIHHVTDPLLRDRKMYPTLYRMTPDNRACYAVIIKYLQHFDWNWVGMVAPGDGSADEEIEVLSKMMSQNEICIEYVMKFTDDNAKNKLHSHKKVFKKSTANVVIISGYLSKFLRLLHLLTVIKENITIILQDSGNDIKYKLDKKYLVVNCSLIFPWHQKVIPGLNSCISGVTSFTRPTDPMQEDMLLWIYNCLTRNPQKNLFYKNFTHITPVNCTEEHSVWPFFDRIEDRNPSSAYTAVYVLANALHSMSRMKTKSGSFGIRRSVS